MAAGTTRLTLVAAAIFGVLAIGAAIAVMFASRSGPELSPAMVNTQGAEIGGPFTLTDQSGARVTEAEVIDGPTLLYFGYTFCPDVCPVDVQVMADTVMLLEEQDIIVRPVFITVDPDRDTPEAMNDYADAMHPRMIGLTGSREDIDAVASAYKVYFQKSGDGEDYLMSHSNFTYLVTPERGLVAMFRSGFPPEQIAADVARLLSAGGTSPAG